MSKDRQERTASLREGGREERKKGEESCCKTDIMSHQGNPEVIFCTLFIKNRFLFPREDKHVPEHPRFRVAFTFMLCCED